PFSRRGCGSVLSPGKTLPGLSVYARRTARKSPAKAGQLVHRGSSWKGRGAPAMDRVGRIPDAAAQRAVDIHNEKAPREGAGASYHDFTRGKATRRRVLAGFHSVAGFHLVSGRI